jgi:hypothetical protein
LRAWQHAPERTTASKGQNQLRYHSCPATLNTSAACPPTRTHRLLLVQSKDQCTLRAVKVSALSWLWPQNKTKLTGSPDLNAVLNSLPTAVDASFNAYQRQHDPTCLPDTRIDLLQEIHNWADGEHSPGIFWLSGLAGTGKSTIARTLVAKHSDTGGIAASFFFSRDGGEGGHRRHAGRFVTSIAVQLANSVQPLKRAICDAISEHSDIANRALREQWRHLVLGPLSKLAGGKPLPVYSCG